MQTDTRDRRLRFAPPQPMNEEIVVVPDDYIHFEAINRHGPLITPILHAFTPEKNLSALQYRWTKFYNGTEKTDPLFTRPPAQFNAFKARYQHIAHDLSELSESLLEERGVPIIRRNDPFVHRLMGACVSSSMELAAGPRYLSRAPILERRSSTLAITVGDKKTVPDELLAIGDQYFAAEWDRHTESTRRKDKSYNTADKKFRAYLDILFHEAFRKHWGVPNLRVLFVTTNLTHMRNLMAYLDGMTTNRLKHNFLFRTKLEFGERWEMPAAPFADILTGWKASPGRSISHKKSPSEEGLVGQVATGDELNVLRLHTSRSPAPAIKDAPPFTS